MVKSCLIVGPSVQTTRFVHPLYLSVKTSTTGEQSTSTGYWGCIRSALSSSSSTSTEETWHGLQADISGPWRSVARSAGDSSGAVGFDMSDMHDSLYGFPCRGQESPS